MARAPAAVVMLGVWIGFLAVEFARDAGYLSGGNFPESAMVGLSQGNQPSEDADENTTHLVASIRNPSSAIDQTAGFLCSVGDKGFQNNLPTSTSYITLFCSGPFL